MRDQAAALHWARALFEGAKTKSVVSRVQTDLAQVLQSRRAGDAVWDALEHPLLAPAKAKELISAAYHKKLHEITFRCLNLLAAKRRVYFLPLLSGHFDQLVDLDQGIVRAWVKSAYPLSDAQKQSLEKSLVKFYRARTAAAPAKLKVLIDAKEDDKLIAGVSVKLGDWVIEHSFRSQLHSLRERMST